MAATDRMRAMAVVDYARPLERLDLPRPSPSTGEVLVRVLYCGVCYSDVKTVTGRMAFSAHLRLPHVAGHEISGEIAAVGPGVALPVGQRVVVYNYWGCGACRACRAGQENLCAALRGWVGFTTPGGFQEYLVVPASHVLPLPPTVPPERAAALSCATGTAYRAVVTRGQVRPGETALVIGAGGVGLHAVQLARAAGARVLAVDVDARKLEAARAHGAAATALAEGAAAWVRRLTDGAGAEVVLDCAGRAESLALASEVVAPGGRVVLVGYTVGERYPIPSAETMMAEISYLGSRYVLRHELARAIQLVADGVIQPVVDSVLDLEEANLALARLHDEGAAGRIVLKVAAG
ncbi:MAG: alcohol dehydrogenase catalytic domain-containing protein [Chloroflexi bacterium]|nr:alcohol dehydrogenase catalytic domain-containing protein [Chloroflexota bacterium]